MIRLLEHEAGLAAGYVVETDDGEERTQLLDWSRMQGMTWRVIPLGFGRFRLNRRAARYFGLVEDS